MKIASKHFNKFLSNKFIAYILIPFLLLFFWVCISLLFNKQISFSILEYGFSDTITNQPNGKLLKGDRIIGEFTAKENGLGIIIIRFRNYVKPDFRGEDVLQFRIKEKSAKNWYYDNSYKSGLIEHRLLYPFGIPIIKDSFNKTYVFELESKNGTAINAVELSSKNPSVISAYELSKNEVYRGSKIVTYLKKKISSSFTDYDFLMASIIYLLPFIFYLFWSLFLKKSLFSKQLFAFFVILLVFVDVFFIDEIYIGILIGLIVAWIISLKIYKFDSSVSFFIAFILILVWLFLMPLNIMPLTDKFNIWSFSFLVIGISQLIIEEKTNPQNLIDYKSFLGNLFKFHK